MKRLVFIAALGLALGACATGAKKDQPDWIDGSDSRYPAARYLKGVGSADTLGRAQDRARANLAKNFEVAVAEASTDVQAFERKAEGEEVETASEERVTRALQVNTDVVLEGVRVAESWQDPETKTRYALALLDRSQASMNLRQEIARLDRATDAVMRAGAGTADQMRRAGSVERAIGLQRQRDVHQRLLKVVDQSGRGVPPVWNLQKLELQLDQELAMIRIGVASESASLELNRLLAGGVAAAGFDHAQPGEPQTYLLVGRLQRQDLGKRDGWYWLRGQLVIELREEFDARVVGTHTWSLKVSATDHQSARVRLLNEADQILKRELRSVVLGFATVDER